ncbi:MAG TPA: zf-HC2 domain-containing protein [bacterium]|nr:zf-HC2 domain-containing protein [bacterium]
MHNSKCDLNEIFIEQFADGELDFKESSEISDHLEKCADCRKKYDEIKFVKTVICDMKNHEVLSVIEKEGFNSLIYNHKNSSSFFQRFKNILFSHSFAVGFSFFSFTSFLILFSYYISISDKQNRLIVNEIIAAHSRALPDEFSGSESTEAELGKNFTVDKNLLKKLSEISPMIRGRFTSIAANPVAKINLEGVENDKGTLFMSKKSKHLKDLFNSKNCVVKNDVNGCKARGFQEKENDLVYWGNKDNDYVFVTDNSKMMAKMVQLISLED